MCFDHTVSLFSGFLAETFLPWDPMENICNFPTRADEIECRNKLLAT